MSEIAAISDPIEDFIEEMGQMTRNDGGPRIAGRILGLAIVEDRAMSLQDIADRLQISKASVSTNARQLAQAGLLRQATRPGSREDHYQLARDPYRELVRSMVKALAEKAAVTAEIEKRLPDDTNGIRDRVRHLSQFYDTVIEALEGCYENLAPAP